MQTETTRHAPGTFCWIDLATNDAPAAKAFYAEVFGWRFVDRALGQEFFYTTILSGEKRVGALFEKNAQDELPPYWFSYVCVDDVDETARKAEVLGATILMGPRDMMGDARVAALVDPVGSVVSLWQPLRHGGLEVSDTLGALIWNELLTRRVPEAESFYKKLFGWTAKTRDMAGATYTVMGNPASGRDTAGVCDYPPESGDMPSFWLVYFAVEDADATASAVTAKGGQVITPPFDVPGIGRLAVVADPQGAIFGIVCHKPE